VEDECSFYDGSVKQTIQVNKKVITKSYLDEETKLIHNKALKKAKKAQGEIWEKLN
jgi:hypothetical protein